MRRPAAVLAPISSRPTSSRRTLCRAEPEQQQATPPAAEQTPAAAPQQSDAPAAPSAPLLAKGQGTAIVTGAISVIFGVAYLLLVQFMDMRGGELLPPPPEAFIP
ncbi:hypothetical protein OEZ86_000515 [Tetradesmus obliquus]|uniref:Mitochondrial import inner membrane translocase subunit Tim21 n=1 Tax=Tetradesmus obliquus TaxID=3088 RepID=A0ABY8TMQ6_TETOB|nr:hypothetical protein OEZ85_010567 [Tetradesmus obliquus]WIA30431.1 hypothetical protein OEZ86_000515 [Tetradesmus obliquus]